MYTGVYAHLHYVTGDCILDNTAIINSTIQEQVYQILRKEVINRVFHEGEQLKEAELAQRFNVSRSPVREALHRLSGDGILTIIPNRGIFVKEFTEKYIIDVLDLRTMLEQRALSRSKEVLTPELEAIFLDMREKMVQIIADNNTDLNTHSTLDTEFHNVIMEMNDNTFVSEVAEKISALNSMFRYLSLRSPERALESQREHIVMIDSLVSGDSDKAIEVYLKHIAGTKKRVVKEFARRSHEIEQ